MSGSIAVRPGWAIETSPPASRHERGAADSEQTSERVISIDSVTRDDERVGYLRPADRPAVALGMPANQRLDVDGQTERGKTVRDVANPALAIDALQAQELDKRRVGRIHKVREEVHVTRGFYRSDLDTWHQAHAAIASGDLSFGQPGAGIVIGHADR